MTDTTPPDGDTPLPDQSEVHPESRGWGLAIFLLLVCLVSAAAVAVSVAKLVGDRHPSGRTVVYVVPEGTAAWVGLGQKVDIMPAEVLLHVGDSISVRNEDTETATVGPFTVRPGETLTQQFQNPQVLKGECSLSGSGEVKIIVT